MADRIGYTNKQRGDLWTATDANEVKSVVNSHATAIEQQAGAVSTLQGSVGEIAQSLNNQQRTINDLAANDMMWVESTEEEIAEMINEGTWEEGVIYYTEES